MKEAVTASLGYLRGEVQQESIVRQLYIQRQLPFLQQQSTNEMWVERLSCLPHVASHGRTGGKARKGNELDRYGHTDLGVSTLG